MDEAHGAFGLQESLEDLSSRFILNVPEEEIASSDRIYFQVEQAHWFYEDFLRPRFAHLPGFGLKKFAELLFTACPVLEACTAEQLQELYRRFLDYKSAVPVCGAIIVNEARDKVLLVKGWARGATWTFPKGKINRDETDINCAARECDEEVGVDLSARMREGQFLEAVLKGEQRTKLYIVPEVSEETVFVTKTRKEISVCSLYALRPSVSLSPPLS
jgi:mRNA-decapping enzyme subunit 2